MDKKSIYSEIFEDYQKDKKFAETKAERMKEYLYKEVPRLREIEYEITEKGVELFKNTLSGKAEVLEDFRNSCNVLKAERMKILNEMGIKTSILKPQYKCEKCKDTGFIDNKKCECFIKRLSEKIVKLSNFGDMLNKENFNKFDYSLFSKDIVEGEKKSPYENINMIIRECLAGIENFENEPLNFLFYGASGLGKTFMCNCIAKELIDRGNFVVYMSAYRLFTIMTNVRFNNASEEEIDTVNYIIDCDLLVIDDLGTEGINNSTIPEFFDILNSRLRNGKSTLISTNLEFDDINVLYSERIFSRVLGNFKVFKFIGKDIRLNKYK